jgi:flagellar P-ring protein precursor FlgI
MMLRLILMIIVTFIDISPVYAARIKDIVAIEGIRENVLVGYGLVVGLNGTGDNLNNSIFTQKGLIDFLERLGINTRGANIKTKNIAAVTVTANLPPFSRQGSKIDIAVSTLGDAKSLQGGTLLATPLVGADGEVYAVAQGQLAIGGFQAASKNNNTTVNKGVATNGMIPSGAIVEKEIDFNINNLKVIKLALRNPDITTATQLAETINSFLREDSARAHDPGTVELSIPPEYEGNVLRLLSIIETIEVNPDTAAKIVIDEASGTIVMGENVRISTVAVAQGNLTITIEENPTVTQPNPLSQGVTTITPNPTIKTDENGKQLAVLESGTTLKQLVSALNGLGVGPRDLITILQNIKSAGALQADIQTR